MRHAARDFADVSQPAMGAGAVLATGAVGAARDRVGAALRVYAAAGGDCCSSLLAVPLGAIGSYVAAPAAQDARYTYAATLICQLLTVGYCASAVYRRRRLAQRRE